MEKLKATVLFLCIAAYSFMLPGCNGRLTLPSDYRTAPFRVLLHGENGMTSFEAEGEYFPSEQAKGEWNFTLRVKLPSFSEEIMLTQAEGVRTVSLENFEANADALSLLFAMAELPVAAGEIRVLLKDNTTPEPLFYGQIEKEGESVPIEVWLDPESGAPRQIRRGALSWRIDAFEALSRKP